MRHAGAGTTRTIPNEKYGHEVVRSWVPVGDPLARMIVVHGIAEYSGRYEEFGERFASAGLEVQCPDLFGFGESGGMRRAYVEEWSDYYDQVQALIGQAAAAEPETPVVLFGHSMGGLIALGYLLSERPQPDLAVLSAPPLHSGAPWQRLLAGPLAAIAPSLTLPNNLDGSLLSRDPEVAELYFADPLVITRTSARLGNYMFKAENAARETLDRLRVPTLVLQGGADRIVSPESTAVLDDLPSVERRLHPKLRHEIFNEPEGPELVQEVLEWLRGQLA
jgi:acylglycerol lipase